MPTFPKTEPDANLRAERSRTAEAHRQWSESNRIAIEAYNQRVAEHGLLSDDARRL
jgi:hypothetical protein